MHHPTWSLDDNKLITTNPGHAQLKYVYIYTLTYHVFFEQPVMPSCTPQPYYWGGYLLYQGLITAGADLGTLTTGDNGT